MTKKLFCYSGEDDSLPDTSSITTLDPTIKAYMIQAAKGISSTYLKNMAFIKGMIEKHPFFI